MIIIKKYFSILTTNRTYLLIKPKLFLYLQHVLLLALLLLANDQKVSLLPHRPTSATSGDDEGCLECESAELVDFERVEFRGVAEVHLLELGGQDT